MIFWFISIRIQGTISLNQKNRLIEPLAVLLKSEIKGSVFKKGEYFSLFNKLDINEKLSYISSLFRLFCSKLFIGKKINFKVTSIEHSITQGVRLRVVFFPLQFTLHCVKSVQIRIFFWSVFSGIRTEYEPEKTPYLDTFRRVLAVQIHNNFGQTLSLKP